MHAVDQAIQTHGGNGLSQEYGVASLLTASRLARIAPVSREMILNFVAQTSWGCPAPTDWARRWTLGCGVAAEMLTAACSSGPAPGADVDLGSGPPAGRHREGRRAPRASP